MPRLIGFSKDPLSPARLSRSLVAALEQPWVNAKVEGSQLSGGTAMKITSDIAAAAVLAGTAVGLAGPAAADDFVGSYNDWGEVGFTTKDYPADMHYSMDATTLQGTSTTGPMIGGPCAGAGTSPKSFTMTKAGWGCSHRGGFITRRTKALRRTPLRCNDTGLSPVSESTRFTVLWSDVGLGGTIKEPLASNMS